MKNVIVMDGEMYLKTIEKSPVLISAEDIEKNAKLQREVVAELCGENGMRMNYVFFDEFTC